MDDETVRVGTRDHQGEGFAIVSNSKDEPAMVRFAIHGLPYTARSVADFFTGEEIVSVSSPSFRITVPAHGGMVLRLVH